MVKILYLSLTHKINAINPSVMIVIIAESKRLLNIFSADSQ